MPEPLVVLSSARPHVSLITLNKPDRLNSMSFGLVGALYAALEQVGADNDCWVAVLTGAGRGFCSGLDLEDMGSAPGLEGITRHRAGTRAMSYMSNVVPAMRAMPQPLIAAINGPAYGGGMCLTLGCDIRIASESAVFCGAGINNGLTGVELGISYLLPRAIGTAHASEILLTGRQVTATEAERIGLVSRVTSDDKVVDTALDMAEDMVTRLSPFGMELTKQAIWDNVEAGSLRAAMDLEDRSQLLAGHTGNLDEAMAAFREKRAPRYTE
jgi:enoyl-CoA hydratase